MATVVVTVRVDGMAAAMQRIDEIKDKLGRTEPGLLRMTNKVAEVWGKNFDAEGGEFQQWDSLGEMTQGMREWQGLDPEHPILYRYGDLRGVAVDFFQKATGDGSQSLGSDPYHDSTEGTLTIRNGLAILQAQGWKVGNQWGHPNKDNLPDTPARPFWFVDSNAIAGAREGAMDWLLDEVLA